MSAFIFCLKVFYAMDKALSGQVFCMQTGLVDDILRCHAHSGKITNIMLYKTSRGRTYVMITYVSKENNLGPGDKIRYIWGLKGPIFIL